MILRSKEREIESVKRAGEDSGREIATFGRASRTAG